MSDALFKAGFDHPCRQTCSGWAQGYERGADDKAKLLDVLKLIATEAVAGDGTLFEIKQLAQEAIDKHGGKK